MRYGNCLIGAIFLMWRERNKNPQLIIQPIPYSLIPHIMVKTISGIHHYKVEKDFLPWPFCYLWFKGYIEDIAVLSFKENK